MFYQVSVEVYADNSDALFLLRDFERIIPLTPALEVIEPYMPLLEEAFTEVESHDAIAHRLQSYVGSFEMARHIVREYFYWLYIQEDSDKTRMLKRWGCASNAKVYYYEEDERVARFNTAYTVPLAVLLRLSQIFPDNTFNVTYAEENLGFNAGRLIVQGGQIVSMICHADGSKVCYDEGFNHWGKKSPYQLVDGQYLYQPQEAN